METGPPVTDVGSAEALIFENISSFASRRVPLARAHSGILREAVLAERDQPPFDRVTMDGIAIAHRDWREGLRTFEVVGLQAAGEPPLALTAPGQCVEIMTGAMLATGADAIVPVERITRDATRVHVQPDLEVAARQFIHPQGSDRAAGSLLLEAGTRLNPPEIAVIAGAGRTEVEIGAAPRVAVISTGDELVEPGRPVAPHQIRSSNDAAIAAALERRCGAAVTRALLKDERATLLERIGALHDDNDVLILSGGVSMGRYDLVPGVLEQLGVELVFHKIEQRPGRPMWFGMSRASKPVFALPGNPVSTLVCLYRYVLPALDRALGATAPQPEIVRLAEAVSFEPDLTYFLPVLLRSAPDGAALAEPRPTNTSGDYVSLATSTGFVELPRGQNHYAESLAVRLFRW